MRKAAVIGFPVKQSLSPFIHNYWLNKYNIKGDYGLLEISPDVFSKERLIMLSRDGYAGFNVTIPHKEKAFLFMDELSPLAKKLGAVNTIVIKEGEKLYGDNTDVYGFIENIKTSVDFKFENKTVCVLGAGGAARAVIYGILNENVNKVILINRTRDKADKIKEEIKGYIEVYDWDEKEDLLEEVDLLVNTTSLGMINNPPLNIDIRNLKKSAVVSDIVYKPLKTELIKNALNNGNKVVEGIGMLLYQAVPGFEYWFGKRPDVTEELKKIILEKC